jgi:predicted chitinase
MPLLSEAQLRQMFPGAGDRLDAHLPFIGPALERAAIDTPERIAAFLAQLAHESGEYRYMEEIADGSAYEGRADLGNTEPGDGVRFKGHGPIQITGRANHRACGVALGIDLIVEPRLICEPEFGTASACWFWNSRGLSPLADIDAFHEITRRINGGFNGWADRVEYWRRNREILGLPPANLTGTTAPRALRKGDTGPDVVALQKALGITPDSDFGPRTDSAVRLFQADQGLVVDGIAGTMTRRALGI